MAREKSFSLKETKAHKPTKQGKTLRKKDVTLKLDEHKISLEELCERLETDPIKGISEDQAKENILRYGKNILRPPSEPHWSLRFFVHNFEGLAGIAWVGIFVCLATYFVEAFANTTREPDIENIYLATSMTSFIFINGCASHYVEWRAIRFQKSVKSKMTYSTIVIRNKKRKIIDVKELTVGDLVEIKAGDRIPADIRVTKSNCFKVDNSNLTGEIDVKLITPKTTNDNPLLTSNLIFFSTFALEGTCQGIVFNIGNNTVVGHIPRYISTVKQIQTLLTKSILRIIVVYSLVGMGVSLTFCILYMRVSLSWLETTLIFVAVYVACVPDQMLMVSLVTLRLIGERMEKNNCLPKHFHTIETIGSTTFICTDKTGFITENKLTVNHLWMGHKIIHVKDPIFEKLEISINLNTILRCITLCGNPMIWDCEDHTDTDSSKQQNYTKTQALQIALIKYARKVAEKNDFEIWTNNILIHETIFHSTTKYCMSIHKLNDHSRQIAVIMGAPEVILKHCSSVVIDGKKVSITERYRTQYNSVCDEMGGLGEKIFGFADMFLNNDFNIKNGIHEYSFRFLGIISMHNPPRPCIPEAISKCKSASIRVIMISKDYPATTQAIAKEIGIITDDTESLVVTGEMLHNMSNEVLDVIIKENNEIIFARTSPHQKLEIIKSCQRQGGKILATGNDVKDCPSMKTADIAVATSIGSDMAKQSADIILLDNSIASIVTGIEHGRLVYENLGKCVMYNITSSIPQLLPFLLFMFLKIPRPLGAFSVLIIAITTDLLPLLSLSYEKPEYDLMTKNPKELKSKLINFRVLRRSYFQIGILEALAGMFAYLIVLWDNGFYPSMLIGLSNTWDSPGFGPITDSYGQEWNYYQRKELEYTCHTAFCFAVISTQMANVITCRTKYVSIVKRKMTNWHLNFAIIFALGIGIYVSALSPGHLENALKQRQLMIYWFLPSIPFVIFIISIEEWRRHGIRKYPNGWHGLKFECC